MATAGLLYMFTTYIDNKPELKVKNLTKNLANYILEVTYIALPI